MAFGSFFVSGGKRKGDNLVKMKNIVYDSSVAKPLPESGQTQRSDCGMKKFLALLLTLVLVLGMTACVNREPETVQLRLATGAPDSTYYTFGGYLGKHATENADYLEVWALESVGSVDSCAQLQVGSVELALCQSDVMVRAYEGGGEFAGEGARVENFSVVGALYREVMQIVTLDPTVKTVADLKGRRVSVGANGTGKDKNVAEILEACSVAAQDVTLVYQTIGESVAALKTGEVDAAFVLTELPCRALAELAAARTTYVIGLEETCLRQLLRENSHYTAAAIPAGTYYAQGEDAATVAVDVVLLARNDVPEESVYALAADLYGGLAELADVYPLCGQTAAPFGASVAVVPYHAGAARYFTEKGFTVPVLQED